MIQTLRQISPIPCRAFAEAPARLHFGFLDPSGTLGRRFAGLGMVIDGLATVIELCPSGINEFEAREAADQRLAARLLPLLARLQGETGAGHPLRIVVHRAIPSHSGLGSGTQLALALGHAFSRAHALALETRWIARLLGRGGRSGIGIAGFDQGGLLLDGGPGPDGEAAPLLARVEFPEEWRILLVMDPTVAGLHGPAEADAIAGLPEFPRERAAELCHRTLMQVLPAVLEGRFEEFADGIGTIQRRIGDYFAPAQGGSMYFSPRVGRAIGWIGQNFNAAVGQSSWGPTGFAVLPSPRELTAAVVALRASDALDPRLELRLVGGLNRGGRTGDSPAAFELAGI